jgi:NAD-dependent dihydropyrimidine dehydrogenase PreA subunit
MLHDSKKCVLCRTCEVGCPEKAVSLENGRMVTDMDKCVFCGKCVTYCMYEARDIAGKEYTVDEVLKTVLQDRVFYRQYVTHFPQKTHLPISVTIRSFSSLTAFSGQTPSHVLHKTHFLLSSSISFLVFWLSGL